MGQKIGVVGIGNLLLKDEGVGVHIINQLKSFQLPDNIELFECGTWGLSAFYLVEGFDKAIMIDAVKAGGEPGTIYKFSLDKTKTDNRLKSMISFHELDFVTAFEIASKVYKLPNRMLIFGVEPKTIEIGLELSPEVKKIIPKVISLIFEEIGQGKDVV